jgi:GNAT superfamily N-acetyltransferase
MQVDDAAALVRFHGTLSPETAYFRFFGFHPELTVAEVKRFTDVDHDDREAIVATSDDEIVAVARWYRLPATSDAEVAFVVADAWQELGLGTALFDRLRADARAVGVTRFLADALAHNHRMLAVFTHSGHSLTMEIHQGVAHVVLDLTPPAITEASS